MRSTASFSPCRISSGRLRLCLLFGVFAAGAAAVRPHRSRASATRFVTPFYLIESLAHAALCCRRRHLQPYGHADAGARPAARRDHHARAEGSLREAMVQDYVLLARLKGIRELRLVLQEALRNAVAPDACADRRAVHVPDRRHRDRRAHLRLSGHRQHGDRCRHQPRLAADPGTDAGVRRAVHPRQHRRRSARRARSIRGCAMADAPDDVRR